MFALVTFLSMMIVSSLSSNEEENFRPQLHYSPRNHWMNDPNGLVHFDGEWHLFYQHYPYEAKAKNIHWGHAVSEDLIHWNELPIALRPENDRVGLWSGSAVIDWRNQTGFQQKNDEPAMIAVYTWQNRGWQEQHMAFSLDRGRTWTKYSSNPIIPLNIDVHFPDENDVDLNASAVVFRDPKLFYHDESEAWIGVISGGDHIQIHRSNDLIHWTIASRFGFNEGSHAGIWECPDLIDFGRFDDGIHRWVFIVSIDRNGIAGGSATQYFVGTFDGWTFTNLNSPTEIQWIDYGPDYYAGITYENVPKYDQRRVIIAWMNNWQYAQDLPTGPRWRGQMAIPRQLDLKWNENKRIYSLRQKPVHELFSSKKNIFQYRQKILNSSSSNLLENIRSTNYFLSMEFRRLSSKTNIHLFVRQNEKTGEATRLSFIGETKRFEFDRSRSGRVDFHQLFRTNYDFEINEETLQLEILVDRCSVEIFVNQGQYAFTALIFPQLQSDQMSLKIETNEQIELNYLDVLLF